LISNHIRLVVKAKKKNVVNIEWKIKLEVRLYNCPLIVYVKN
jgi:hypothetical protein